MQILMTSQRFHFHDSRSGGSEQVSLFRLKDISDWVQVFGLIKIEA